MAQPVTREEKLAGTSALVVVLVAIILIAILAFFLYKLLHGSTDESIDTTNTAIRILES